MSWHLLTHTAGIGELPWVADVLHPAARGMARPGAPAVDLAGLYQGVLRAEINAGTKWAYANHGFAVAAQLIQDLSGVPLPRYMREHLFDPLGMGSSDYVRSDRVAGAVAVGHQWKRGRLRPLADYDRSLLGPGAVCSTLADMARYAQALLQGGVGEGGRVLEPETLQVMWSPQYSPDPRIPGIGLGFFLDRLGGHREVGHDGNLPGFASGCDPVAEF
jgi:CubicO group peptidase (beta-lactamase class C family)